MTTVQAPPAELSPIQFESLKAWQRWTAAAEHPDVLRPVDCQSVSAMLGELPKAARWGRSSQIFTPSQQHQQPTSAKVTDDQDLKKSYDAQGWLRAEHLVSATDEILAALPRFMKGKGSFTNWCRERHILLTLRALGLAQATVSFEALAGQCLRVGLFLSVDDQLDFFHVSGAKWSNSIY